MAWPGRGVMEIILAGELDEASVNAVRRRASAVFGIRNISYYDPAVPAILRRLGVDTTPFSTLLILR